LIYFPSFAITPDHATTHKNAKLTWEERYCPFQFCERVLAKIIKKYFEIHSLE